jgi:hypothetical protein
VKAMTATRASRAAPPGPGGARRHWFDADRGPGGPGSSPLVGRHDLPPGDAAAVRTDAGAAVALRAAATVFGGPRLRSGRNPPGLPGAAARGTRAGSSTLCAWCGRSDPISCSCPARGATCSAGGWRAGPGFRRSARARAPLESASKPLESSWRTPIRAGGLYIQAYLKYDGPSLSR